LCVCSVVQEYNTLDCIYNQLLRNLLSAADIINNIIGVIIIIFIYIFIHWV
jgi:hypothetical protein